MTLRRCNWGRATLVLAVGDFHQQSAKTSYCNNNLKMLILLKYLYHKILQLNSAVSIGQKGINRSSKPQLSGS